MGLKRQNKTETKNLLQWNTGRKASKAIDREVSSPRISLTPSGTFNGERPVEETGFSAKNYKWSDQKRKQYAGSSPYGVDESETIEKKTGSINVSGSKSVNKSNPVSLFSLLSQKIK